MVFGVYRLDAQVNTLDPYNNLGNPANPNNLPQSNYSSRADTTGEDTVTFAKKEKKPFKLKHNPVLATVFSAVIPGAGQIYNGKFWKVPIFWGVMGTIGYFFSYNQTRYQDFRDAFAYTTLRDPNNFNNRLDTNTAREGYNEIYNKYENEILPFEANGSGDETTQAARLIQFERDNARRTRDYMAVFFIVSYVCNIMDAAVDAHFHNFDVSDKLSLNIKPTFLNPVGNPQLGLNMNFTFHEKKYKKPIF